MNHESRRWTRRALLAAVTAAIGVLLVLPAGPALAAGSASGSTSAEIRSAPRSPEASAASRYRAAIKHKEKAWKQEAKAARASSDGKRDKLLAKAQKEYAKAIDDLSAALKILPDYYEAATELGYALRKTGDYPKSIGAYNYALQLNPNHHEAMEYRAQAFLALGYLDEAKRDYMALFRGDQELAAQLMASMEAWVTGQPADDARVTEFAAWLAERKELARITGELSLNSARSW